MTQQTSSFAADVPEGCAPGAYRLYREYFVANYLDGDGEGGVLTVNCKQLADDIAEMFSSEHWRNTWNDALFEKVRNWDHEAQSAGSTHKMVDPYDR